MKIIVLGDIHGKDFWKKITGVIDNYDKVVFVGDYWDSYDIPFIKQEENYREIISFKNKYPDKVTLLFGNHDLHYYAHLRYTYSGYQPHQHQNIYELLKREVNNGNIQASYYFSDGGKEYIISHAGISNVWLENTFPNEILESTPEDISNKINELFYFKPNQFDIKGVDPYGDSIYDGPMWIRPDSLYRSAPHNLVQIIGHTKMPDYRRLDFANTKVEIHFVDVFDTISDKFFTLEDGRVKIITL